MTAQDSDAHHVQHERNFVANKFDSIRNGSKTLPTFNSLSDHSHIPAVQVQEGLCRCLRYCLDPVDFRKNAPALCRLQPRSVKLGVLGKELLKHAL